MSRATFFSRAVLVVPFLSLAAAGQTPTSNWEDVKVLAPGTEVRVAADNSKPIRGKLDSVTDSNLVLRLTTGTQSFPQPEIHGVSVQKKGHRLRNTLIGMGLGTAVGAGIGASQTSGCKELLCDLALPVFAVIGFVGGTVTGLVWPTGGWRQVYAR